MSFTANINEDRQTFGNNSADCLVQDSLNGGALPLSSIVPIRWRQILRASFARFFRSRFHVGLVVGDIVLILAKDWDNFGILSAAPVHTLLVVLLIYEATIFLLDLVYQFLYYRSYFYDVREESVVISRGVLCRKEITLPLGRITDVYLEQDFISRLLGLYDLHLSSPTKQSGTAAHMSGIDRRGAEALRGTIVELINQANIKFNLELAGATGRG